MKHILVKDVIRETNGTLVQGNLEEKCDNYCRDTREVKEGDTYIGLQGETFDGSSLWKEALDNGAKVVIVQDVEFSQEELEKYKDKVIIKVEDTLKALHNIAKYKRSMYNIPVIAITGSVGKTSTKDMIANVVAQKYLTLKTEANQNNEIGMPLTILRLKDEGALVVEMGMNHFGEISRLTDIAKPTLAVITNIGTSHIGNLGSRENILKAKLEILEGMSKKIVVINNDNDLLNGWKKQQNDDIEIHTFGIENKSEIMAECIEEYAEKSKFKYKTDNVEYEINVPVGGKHFVSNAICSIVVGKILEIEPEKIKKGIETFELTKKRMDIVKLENGATIINDSYNASYESMKAAIEYLSALKDTRKIAVLGDMLELGEFSKELHAKVGVEVAKNNIDMLMCTGEESKQIELSAIKNGMNKENVKHYNNIDEITEELKSILKETDTVLVKASNGMKFFEIVERLKEFFS